MEKTRCTDCVRNEDVLHRVKKDRNMLRKVNGREGIWIGHMLLRNCLKNTLLKERQKGREENEEAVSSYGMALRK